MNWNQIESNWKHLKGNIQYQWSKLSDDDLETINGKRDELARRIQETYGLHQDEAEKQVDDWKNNDLADPSDEDLEYQMYYSANLKQTNEFDYDDDIKCNTDKTRLSLQDGIDKAGNGGAGNGDCANPNTSNPKPNPNSNPKPNSTDEQPRDSDNETPHEDKSLDQT